MTPKAPAPSHGISNRLPIGSLPAKYFLTSASFATYAGDDSASVTQRPFKTRMPIVDAYPADTTLDKATGRSGGAVGGAPSMESAIRPSPLELTPADSTSGAAFSRRSISSMYARRFSAFR